MIGSAADLSWFCCQVSCRCDPGSPNGARLRSNLQSAPAAYKWSRAYLGAATAHFIARSIRNSLLDHPLSTGRELHLQNNELDFVEVPTAVSTNTDPVAYSCHERILG